eukprot:Seg3429.2 transcript_id=Seg3429.2/GoldUCD/mRNA.D3Y31 product="hypothetical protein" protein_id=Seg3429.2/GoldUCD/D3Y31
MSLINVIKEIAKSDELLNEKCLSIAKEIIERRVIRAMREENLVFNVIYRDVWYGDIDLIGLSPMQPMITVHVILQLPFVEHLKFDETTERGRMIITARKPLDNFLSSDADKEMRAFFYSASPCNPCYLSSSYVNGWFSNVLVEAIHRMRQYGGLSRIAVRRITHEKDTIIYVATSTGIKMKIRFNPVFEYGVPLSDDVIFCTSPYSEASNYFSVPLNRWDCLHPFEETDNLKTGGRETMEIIWLLQRLSAYLQLPDFYSYVFRNTVLLMVANGEWYSDELEKNFLNALKKLKNCEGHISHWLDDRINLIGNRNAKKDAEKISGALEVFEDAEKCDPAEVRDENNDSNHQGNLKYV